MSSLPKHAHATTILEVARLILPLIFLGVAAGTVVDHDELQAYVSSLGSLKPEVQTDILLTLSSASTLDIKARTKLAVETFDLADRLENPLPARVPKGVYTDSDAALKARAFTLKLDTLSVKMRVVDELLKFDPKKALELFTQTPMPNAPPSSCESPLVPDVTAYYITLGHLLSSPRTSKNAGGLVSSAFHQHPNVPDLFGLLALFRMDGLTIADKQTLSSYLETELSNAEPDPRAFQTLLPELQSSLQDAVLGLGRRSLSNKGILTAAKSFLITQAHGTVCESKGGANATGVIPQKLAEFYNSQLISKAYPPDPAISSVAASDLAPSKTEAAVSAHDIWKSSGAVAVLNAVRKARSLLSTHADDDGAGTTISETLGTLDSWQPNDLSAEEVFHAKSILYFTLLSAGQSNPAYNAILGSYVLFLEQEDRSVPPLAWLLHAKELLSLAMKPGAKITTKDSALLAYQILAKLQEPPQRQAN